MKKKFEYIFLIQIVVMVIVFSACNQFSKDDRDSEKMIQNDQGQINEKEIQSDGSFILDQSAFNLKMIQMAKVALEMSQKKETTELAKKMIGYHQQSYDELGRLAIDYKISLPVVLNESDKIEIQELKNKSSKDFDRKFSDLIIRDHTVNTTQLEYMAGKASLEPLRLWCQNFVPTYHQIVEEATQSDNMPISKGK